MSSTHPLFAVALAISLPSCASMQGMAKGDPYSFLSAPFELLADTVDTAQAAINLEKPEWQREAERRKQIKQDNEEREQSLLEQTSSAEARIRSLRMVIDDLKIESDDLLAENRSLKEALARNALTLDEQAQELATLREAKADLAAKIEEARADISQMQVSSTVDYYIQQRRAEGGIDPVEEQLQRLRGIQATVNNTVLP